MTGIRLRGRYRGRRVTGRMRVYLPRGYPSRPPYRLLIALHGWNRRARAWQKKSVLAPLADGYGLVVACPAMGRTVYETAYYPQTRGLGPRTPGMPGARWISRVVLPHLRRRYLVSERRADTGLLGVSTGGRGAVLVAERDARFGFAGALSGTFDLMALRPGSGEYRIHRRVYGPRTRFPKRWRLDNPVRPALLRGLRRAAPPATHPARPAAQPARPGASPTRTTTSPTRTTTSPTRTAPRPARAGAPAPDRPAPSAPARSTTPAPARSARSTPSRGTNPRTAESPRRQRTGWIPVFLAHGLRDRSVRPRQTRRLARALKRRGARPRVVLDPRGGHDWRFWNAQLSAALAHWRGAPPRRDAPPRNDARRATTQKTTLR